MKRAPLWDVGWLFIVTRILLVIVTYFGYILLTQEKYSGTPVPIVTFVNAWDQWDAKQYVQIAQHGYQAPYYTLAFYPLYPLLIALPARLLGDWSYFSIGMLISNAALLGSLFLLYQLACEAGGEEVAKRTLLYLCIFPTAFFFFHGVQRIALSVPDPGRLSGPASSTLVARGTARYARGPDTQYGDLALRALSL